MKRKKFKTVRNAAPRILGIVNREVTDPKEKARILDLLEEEELTYELGVEAAEAGISFLEWPYRCLRAKDFKRGWRSVVTTVEMDHLTVSEDGATIINKAVN